MAEFRPVISKEDISEVAQLAREIWQEHYLPIIGQDQVDYMLEKFQSRDAITRQIAQKYEYYLVLDRGQSAGYVGVVPNPGKQSSFSARFTSEKSCADAGWEKQLSNLRKVSADSEASQPSGSPSTRTMPGPLHGTSEWVSTMPGRLSRISAGDL